jgi:hypothetical protein
VHTHNECITRLEKQVTNAVGPRAIAPSAAMLILLLHSGGVAVRRQTIADAPVIAVAARPHSDKTPTRTIRHPSDCCAHSRVGVCGVPQRGRLGQIGRASFLVAGSCIWSAFARRWPWPIRHGKKRRSRSAAPPSWRSVGEGDPVRPAPCNSRRRGARELRITHRVCVRRGKPHTDYRITPKHILIASKRRLSVFYQI